MNCIFAQATWCIHNTEHWGCALIWTYWSHALRCRICKPSRLCILSGNRAHLKENGVAVLLGLYVDHIQVLLGNFCLFHLLKGLLHGWNMYSLEKNTKCKSLNPRHTVGYLQNVKISWIGLFLKETCFYIFIKTTFRLCNKPLTRWNKQVFLLLQGTCKSLLHTISLFLSELACFLREYA